MSVFTELILMASVAVRRGRREAMGDFVLSAAGHKFWLPVELLNLTFECELDGRRASDAKLFLPREACVSLFLLLHLRRPRKGR